MEDDPQDRLVCLQHHDVLCIFFIAGQEPCNRVKHQKLDLRISNSAERGIQDFNDRVQIDREELDVGGLDD